MCGIAGVIKIHDPMDGPPPSPLEAIPEQWLDILDESIKHRGPDGQGRFRDRAIREDGTIVDVALVHRRLSIIDHEGGHQPMVHDGERLRPDLTYQPGNTPIIASEVEPDKPLVAVVFNGCIYNHRELRKELEGQGYVFETDHSDTEVLVHGWRAWERAFADQLNTMAACGIWDGSTTDLILSRDLCGQKPLYECGMFSNTLAFGSVPSGLWALRRLLGLDLISGRTGPEIKSWIRFGYELPANYGLIPIESYRAGESIRYGPMVGRDRALRSSPSSRRSMRVDNSHVHELLQNGISAHLEADVPVSVFLSGGIDSALVTSLAVAANPEIECLTVRMPHPDYDESIQASETAKHLGVNQHIIECDATPADDLVDLIARLGLPFGDSSLLPAYWVCRAARDTCKVALSGDGADELFAGYERHKHGQLINTLSTIPFVGRALTLKRRDESNPKSRSSKVARAARAIQHGGYLDLLSIFDTSDFKRLVSPDRVQQLPWHRSVIQYDFDAYLPNDILRKTDTASMAVPLEVRAPFLDRHIVETMRAAPRRTLMPNGERKGLLKQVARKYLPDHIVDRPKQGFAIPIGEWFRSDYGGMRQLLYDHLHSSDPFPGLAESGVELNMKFVEQMLKEHDAAGEKSINPWHGRDHSQRLYMLLVLSIWAKWLDRVREGTEQSA